jgi:hypothetical protein
MWKIFESIDQSLRRKPKVKIDESKIEVDNNTGTVKPKLSLVEMLMKEFELMKASVEDRELITKVALPLIAKVRQLAYDKISLELVHGESIWLSMYFPGDIVVHFEVHVKPVEEVMHAFFTLWKTNTSKGKIMWTNGYGKITEVIQAIKESVKAAREDNI